MIIERRNSKGHVRKVQRRLRGLTDCGEQKRGKETRKKKQQQLLEEGTDNKDKDDKEEEEEEGKKG
jgi:hypothetical protein